MKYYTLFCNLYILFQVHLEIKKCKGLGSAGEDEHCEPYLKYSTTG